MDLRTLRLRKLNAMRQQKYRQKKVIEDPDFKKRENERIKKLHEKRRSKLTSAQAEELRIRKTKQKRLEREKKRQLKLASVKSNELHTSSPSGFETNSHVQSYSKAVRKCIRSLPSCPVKQKHIVEGVCEQLGLKLTSEQEKSLSSENDSETLCDKLEKKFLEKHSLFSDKLW